MKKGLFVGVNISLILVCFFVVINLLPFYKVVKENPFMSEEVSICAHRGGALLNPENTQKAFDYVILETDYTDIVEIDIRLTKDNIIVISHDDSINRLALDDNSLSVDISKNNYEDLQEYNLGRNFVDLNGNQPYLNYGILQAKEEKLTLMSLEEFFIKYQQARDFKVFLDIKESGKNGEYLVDKVNVLLAKYSWWKNKVMLIAFDDELLDYTINKYPSIYVGALGDKVVEQIVYNKLGLEIFYKPNVHSIQIPLNDKAKNYKIKLTSKSIINNAHKRNQMVVYWGVNNIEDMNTLINIGTDVITTDRPDVLASILNG